MYDVTIRRVQRRNNNIGKGLQNRDMITNPNLHNSTMPYLRTKCARLQSIYGGKYNASNIEDLQLEKIEI
jgi:hypothetical protein